jgi:hypothetical protein
MMATKSFQIKHLSFIKNVQQFVKNNFWQWQLDAKNVKEFEKKVSGITLKYSILPLKYFDYITNIEVNFV